MVHSMTGYGRAREMLHGREIMVEIKSVNSRYFEYFSRLPRNCAFLDDLLKKTVAAGVGRGKTELHVTLQSMQQADVEVQMNRKLAKEYYAAIGDISHELGILNNATATTLAHFNDVFTLKQTEVHEDELTADVLIVAKKAVAQLRNMRAAEGEKLVADVRERLAFLQQMLLEVEKDGAGRVERYTQKLHTRLQEVLQDTTIDEARLLTEAAIFADKTAVDEETVRLHSHLKQYAEILSEGGSIGRKLDFLTQEMNREVNTVGSKCQEIEITRIVVDMKAEIEKIREQIQNIE